MTSKALLLFTGLLLAGRVLANDAALEWFQRMQHAMQSTDYQGRFVYQVGWHLESMFIDHRVQDGREAEELISLDGARRELVTHNGVVTIKSGHRAAGGVDACHADTPGIPRFVAPDRLLAHYDLRLAGVERIAGRMTQVLDITPKDSLRYGYRLYLDQATGLPLRSIMFDPSGKQLSQLMFVDLETKPVAGGKQAQQPPPQRHTGAGMTAEAPKTVSAPWKFKDLPPGYVLVGYHLEPNQHLQHMIFSDGISVMSLYVEPEQADPMAGYSHVGVTGIYAEPKMGHQFTALGVVPADALRMLVHAVDAGPQ